MMARRGQLQTEHLFLIGVLVFLSLLLLYYAVNEITGARTFSQAEEALDHLAGKINEVAGLSPGTRDSAWVDIPSRTFDVRFSGKSLSLVLLRDAEEQHIFTRETFADVIGHVNFTSGLQQIHVMKINDTTVKVGTGPFIMDIIPVCLSVADLATTPLVMLFGADFLPQSQVFANGLLVSSFFLSSGELSVPTQQLHSLLGTSVAWITVQTPPDLVSNRVCFDIYTPASGCECP